MRLLAAGSVAMAGCSSTWQSTEPVQAVSYPMPQDAVPRYAGKLRRVVLLPALYEPGEVGCASTPPDEAGRLLGEAAREYLVDWKGYEVVQPASEDEALARLIHDLGLWQVRGFAEGRPPEPLRGRLLAMATAARADGVAVLHAVPECIGTLDIALNLLGVGMPSFYRKALGPNFSAGLYAATDGALVWQRRIGIGPASEGPLSREDAARSVESLFGVLENAIPEVLVR